MYIEQKEKNQMHLFLNLIHIVQSKTFISNKQVSALLCLSFYPADLSLRLPSRRKIFQVEVTFTVKYLRIYSFINLEQGVKISYTKEAKKNKSKPRSNFC